MTKNNSQRHAPSYEIKLSKSNSPVFSVHQIWGSPYIQWPPDVSEVSEHYWLGYGYEFGIPMHYPAGWRPFYEEQPWYNDPVQRGRILELLPPEIPPDSIQP